MTKTVNGDAPRLRAAVASGVRAASQSAKSAALVLPLDDVDLRVAGEGAGLGAYRFVKYFTGDRRPKTELTKLSVGLPYTLRRGEAIGAARAEEGRERL